MGDRVAASGGREVEGGRRTRGSAEEGSGEGGVARSRKNVQESDGRSGGMGEGEVNRGRRKVQEDEGAPERKKEGDVNRGRRKVHEDEGVTERKKDGEVAPERSRKKVQEGDAAQGRGGEDKVESSEGGGQEGRARKSAGHGRYGHRRDPATGHRLRRNKTPEPNLKAEPGPETPDDARRERVKRSQSTPGEGRTPKISSSEEEEDRKPRRVLKVKGESASIRKVKEEEEKPRPAVRTRSKSRGREEDEGKENGWDKSAWWKSWPGWTQRIRGKSLERESLGGAPQALPRRRNKSLERPPVIREKEKRLAKKEEAPVARKRSKSKSPRSISDEEEKQRERERRPSVEESSDDFWKVGEGVRKRKVDERVVEIIDDRVPALEDVKPAAEPAEEEVGQSVPAENVGKDQESRFKEKFKLSFSIVEAIKEWRTEWRFFLRDNGREVHRLKTMWQRCAVDVVLLVMYCGTGALVFRFTEGAFENFYKCGVKRVKREFVDGLWTGAFAMREDDWKSMARRKLWEFEEQLQVAFEAGSTSYSGVKAWSFVNAFLYCLTVVTTIGYGHISPVTTTGRAITMVYAIFGIPMFLIVLADFGKLFTRGIKFVWAFVRRVYYTGSCRKVRRTVPVHEMMKGVQMVYDIATFRRPSQLPPGVTLEDGEGGGAPPLPPRVAHSPGEPPGTPALSTFAIDDEFNLPISLAIFILLLYIICGALVFTAWEEWTFFESFYFVFISMSTIGFGDITPNHPMYMMASIIYLVFGLALTSMCINVVQEKLSDSFRQASAKIGATIGFRVGEDDGSVTPAAPPPVEIAEVHGANKTTTNGAPTST